MTRWRLILVIAASIAVAVAQDTATGDGDPLRDFLDSDEPAKAEPDQAEPEATGRNPFESSDRARSSDALAGVIELSNGTRLAGVISTTPLSPLVIYVPEQQRFRRVFLPAILNIEAIVVAEKMELEWRWKAMGVPERVYTGRKLPTRRLTWKITLIDGTAITGAIKGDPLWIEVAGRRSDPLILHERQKGKPGQEMKDLLYIRKVCFSAELMRKVQAARKAEARHGAEEAPAP